MTNFRIMRVKPLLYWSVFSRIGVALILSLMMWFLVMGVTYSS